VSRPPLRIGFDLDGTLADMESALARESILLFGPESGEPDEPVEPIEPSEHRERREPREPHHLTSRQQQHLWRHVNTIDNFWETLDESEPGIVARLASLATSRRWEIIFLTKRPETAGATAQVQTQRWLAAKGFPLPSVFVVQRSRGRIAASLELDLVIDDRPENCLDVVVDSKARAILVWRADAKLLPPAACRVGIGVVSSVSGCLDILMEIGTAPDQPTGVLNRVLRLLGLKEPSNPAPFDGSLLDATQQSQSTD
jgi:hypothetical protein